MNAKELKIKLDVPCMYLSWNEKKGREEPSIPSVDCSRHCYDCGFNPEEKARRLNEGEHVTKDGITTLRFKRKEMLT